MKEICAEITHGHVRKFHFGCPLQKQHHSKAQPRTQGLCSCGGEDEIIQGMFHVEACNLILSQYPLRRQFVAVTRDQPRSGSSPPQEQRPWVRG